MEHELFSIVCLMQVVFAFLPWQEIDLWLLNSDDAWRFCIMQWQTHHQLSDAFSHACEIGDVFRLMQFDASEFWPRDATKWHFRTWTFASQRIFSNLEYSRLHIMLECQKTENGICSLMKHIKLHDMPKNKQVGILCKLIGRMSLANYKKTYRRCNQEHSVMILILLLRLSVLTNLVGACLLQAKSVVKWLVHRASNNHDLLTAYLCSRMTPGYSMAACYYIIKYMQSVHPVNETEKTRIFHLCFQCSDGKDPYLDKLVNCLWHREICLANYQTPFVHLVNVQDNAHADALKQWCAITTKNQFCALQIRNQTLECATLVRNSPLRKKRKMIQNNHDASLTLVWDMCDTSQHDCNLTMPSVLDDFDAEEIECSFPFYCDDSIAQKNKLSIVEQAQRNVHDFVIRNPEHELAFAFYNCLACMSEWSCEMFCKMFRNTCEADRASFALILSNVARAKYRPELIKCLHLHSTNLEFVQFAYTHASSFTIQEIAKAAQFALSNDRFELWQFLHDKQLLTDEVLSDSIYSLWYKLCRAPTRYLATVWRDTPFWRAKQFQMFDIAGESCAPTIARFILKQISHFDQSWLRDHVREFTLFNLPQMLTKIEHPALLPVKCVRKCYRAIRHKSVFDAWWQIYPLTKEQLGNMTLFNQCVVERLFQSGIIDANDLKEWFRANPSCSLEEFYNTDFSASAVALLIKET